MRKFRRIVASWRKNVPLTLLRLYPESHYCGKNGLHKADHLFECHEMHGSNGSICYLHYVHDAIVNLKNVHNARMGKDSGFWQWIVQNDAGLSEDQTPALNFANQDRIAPVSLLPIIPFETATLAADALNKSDFRAVHDLVPPIVFTDQLHPPFELFAAPVQYDVVGSLRA